MKWRVEIRPQVEEDVAEAARWYEARSAGLGLRFVDEVIGVWRELAENPMLASRRHPRRNIRWRFPKSFPFRIIYEVDEASSTVVVIAVLHAARADDRWRGRLP